MHIHIDFKGLWHNMPNKREILSFFTQVCTLQHLNNIAFEILICDDKQSKYLNQRYLSSNSPTNVLSFNELRKEESIIFLGSLVLSRDTLKREAFFYGQNKESYTKELLLHGFAHLLGLEHGKKMDIFCEQVKHLTLP